MHRASAAVAEREVGALVQGPVAAEVMAAAHWVRSAALGPAAECLAALAHAGQERWAGAFSANIPAELRERKSLPSEFG